MLRRLRFLTVFLLMAGTGFPQDFVGFIDGYYSYNFNKPGTNKNLFHNFNFNHNQFSLNYAELAIEKKPGTSPVGFRADIGFGDTAKWVHSAEPGGVDVWQYFQQAYVSAAHKKVQVDFGKFVTQHGAEVIETKDNWNYTRSLLFAWAIPYYHFGTRVAFAANDKVTLAASLNNGWNNVVDNNQGKTFGAAVIVKPTSKFTWVQNYMVGKEQNDNIGVRHLVDSTAMIDVSPKLSLMANYDYGMDRSAGSRVRWQGYALYAKVTPHDRFKFSPRFEWFDDPNGFTTGTSHTMKEITLTSEFGVAEGMFLRGEYRHDWSTESIFPDGPKGFRDNQNTVTIGVVYTITKAAK